MDASAPIPAADRHRLRELARRKAAIADEPVMADRRRRWYAHNRGEAGEPMVVIEIGTFAHELLGDPEPRCEHPFARGLERQLQLAIVNHELVDDDKVVDDTLRIPCRAGFRLFDLAVGNERASDAKGRSHGFRMQHPISDLVEQIDALGPSQMWVDSAGAEADRQRAEELVGDILRCQTECGQLTWFASPSIKVVQLMGMEEMFCTLLEEPATMARLYGMIAEEHIRFFRLLEEAGCITANNGNHYAGAGSYGFTEELPDAAGCTRELWGNLNSQETVGVDPRLYAEVVFPAYERLAREFGLLYYGCCEPTDHIWEPCLSRLPNLRKLSINRWCDERLMGPRLREAGVIYSRKPDPNLLAVGRFDAEAFRAHVNATLSAAEGCTLEFIYRDVMSLDGDRGKPGEAVRIIRECAAERVLSRSS